MEYGKSTLTNQAQGTCDGCGQQKTLGHTITVIEKDLASRDGLGHPRVRLGQAFLLCGECSERPPWND